MSLHTKNKQIHQTLCIISYFLFSKPEYAYGQKLTRTSRQTDILERTTFTAQLILKTKLYICFNRTTINGSFQWTYLQIWILHSHK